MGLDVLGLGAVAMDVVLNCPELPQEDGFALIRAESLVPGGSCANLISAVVSLGHSGGLVCQIGDDSFGAAFSADLARRGIDASRITVKPGGVTLHTYVAVAEDGSRSILAHPGDCLMDLSPDRVAAAMLDGVKVFYTDMMPPAPSLKLARAARGKGVRVVFGLEVPIGFHQMMGTSRQDIETMIGLADLFITNRQALAELTDRRDPADGLAEINRRYAPSAGAVVTLGSEGSLWQAGPDLLLGPTLTVAVKDTTGAGDAFAAGLISGLFLENRHRRAALDLATAAAALKCGQPGPRLAGSREEVEELLKRK